MRPPLTPRQADVLEAIKRLLKLHPFPPTILELCDEVGVSSSSTMHFHLASLKGKGYINFIQGEKRTIHLKEEVNV